MKRYQKKILCLIPLMLVLLVSFQNCEENESDGGSGGVELPLPDFHITIDTPKFGSYINQNNYTNVLIEGRCSEVAHKVVLVSNLDQPLIGETVCLTDGWRMIVDTSVVNDGVINVIALHYNNKDDEVKSKEISITKDTQAPVLNFNSLNLVNGSNSQNYNISGSCSETNQDVILFSPINKTTPCISGNWAMNLNLSDYSEGIHPFDFKLKDKAGNESASRATLQRVMPSLTSTTPVIVDGSNESNVIFSGSCSENDRYVSISTPTSKEVDCKSGWWSMGINLTSLNAGGYDFQFNHIASDGTSANATSSVMRPSSLVYADVNDILGSSGYLGLASTRNWIAIAKYSNSAVKIHMAKYNQQNGKYEVKQIVTNAGFSNTNIRMDMDDQTLAISFYCSYGGGCSTGKVFVLRNNAEVWSVDQELVSKGIGSGDHYGKSLAASGDRVVVGNFKGSITVFKLDNNTWSEEQSMVYDYVSPTTYQGLSFDGTTIALGTTHETHQKSIGRLTLFKNDGSGWVNFQNIYDAKKYLGSWVSVDNDNMLVGYYKGVRAYKFNPSNQQWYENGSLTTTLHDSSYSYFPQVRIDGNIAIAWGRTNNVVAGKVYVAEKIDEHWIRNDSFSNPNPLGLLIDIITGGILSSNL